MEHFTCVFCSNSIDKSQDDYIALFAHLSCYLNKEKYKLTIDKIDEFVAEAGHSKPDVKARDQIDPSQTRTRTIRTNISQKVRTNRSTLQAY